MPVLYLAVLILILLLILLSAKENPVSDQPVSAWMRPVRRAAVYLYRKILGLYRHFRPGSKGFPGSGKVQKELSILDASRMSGRKTVLYYIDKIQMLLLFAIAADLLAAAVWYTSLQEGNLSADGSVERPGYGESSIEISVIAGSSDEENVEFGEFTVEIDARQYTGEQAEVLAEELEEQLPQLILADNESLDRVTENLNLMKSVDGYPFAISWESSRYEWINSDGTVHGELIEEGGSEEVTLKAIMTYREYSFEEEYAVTVCPTAMTEEEQMEQAILEALEDSNRNTATGTLYYLPDEADGILLTWTEATEDSSLALFFLVLAAGALSFFMGDRDLHQKLEQREKQMALDYPQIVSKLVLFLGAGMSVRNAFAKLGDSYQEARKKGGEMHYVYEEILLVCRELDSGISESTAYSHFGYRCRARQYTKLCSLLTQNLKKGNSTLLQALQEEADLAFEERKSLARKMGEEAGTKLLLPMIMMLAVTLVIIMVPAYLSFSF